MNIEKRTLYSDTEPRQQDRFAGTVNLVLLSVVSEKGGPNSYTASFSYGCFSLKEKLTLPSFLASLVLSFCTFILSFTSSQLSYISSLHSMQNEVTL